MYIGIDIGGTDTRVAGSPLLDNIALVGKSLISTPQTFEEGIFEISRSIKSISDNPQGIGIGIAGDVSESGREFIGSTNLCAWANKPIIKTLENEFGCFVCVENDAVAQSLGEVYYGLKPDKNFLYLVWGTGLGGALVTQKGKGVRSVEVGRPYLGGWEKKFGGKNIEGRFGKKAKDLNEEEWAVVLSEFRRSIQDLSGELNVDCVVIGGGIVDRQKKRISKVVENISSPKILFSELGENAGVCGGLALIKAKMKG